MAEKSSQPSFVPQIAVGHELTALSGPAEGSVDGQNTLTKRVPKCSACKLPHDVHTWSEPGPYCTGPTDAEADHTNGQSADPEDDENTLLEHLKKLKLAEQTMEKASRV